MGTGYTRNDTSNNIADGNIINAADLDGEFDAVESAFNSSTGHTHDGTAAEGGAITVVGPVQDLVVSATEVKPKTTNTLDLGTSALLYKDAYLQGNMYFRDTALKIVSSADGQLDIDADVELELVAPTVDIDASTALTVDTASTTFTSTLFNVTGSANITGDLDVDNININGNTIISTDTNGAINITPNGTGAVNITATTNITGDLDVDNININGNTIISTDTNGDINISPDGTGTVVIDTDLDVDNININGNTIISTDTNGDINISPDGTGTVVIDTDLDVDNININGNTISSTDTNGNINLVPDGTGVVNLTDNDKLTFGAGSDLQIYHDGTNSYIDDSGTGILWIRGDASVRIGKAGTSEVGLRVESDSYTKLYYDNSEKLATTSTGVDVTGELQADSLDIDGVVDIDGATTITVTGNSAALTLESTDDDADLGPLLTMYRNSATPADSDLIGHIQFTAEDSIGNPTVYSSLQSRIRDVTNGTEDGELKIEIRNAGSNTETLTLKPEEVVFNEAGVDQDFRVESDSNSHMFFVDAGVPRVNVGGNGGAHTFNVNGSMGLFGAATEDRNIEIGFGRTDDGNSYIDLIGDTTYTDYGARFIRQGGENAATQIVHRGTGTLNIGTEDAGKIDFFTNGIGNRFSIASSGNVTVNEDSADADFRVESDSNSNMFVVDAGLNQVGVGAAPDGSAALDAVGRTLRAANIYTKYAQYSVPTATYVDVYWNDDTITLDTGYTYRFQLATLSTGTNTGVIYWVWYDDTSWNVDIESRHATSSNNPQGRVDSGKFQIFHSHPSTYSVGVHCEARAMGTDDNTRSSIGLPGFITVYGDDALVFNEQGDDLDFRVESDANANMLFVDAGTNRVGIGTTPQQLLHIFDGGGTRAVLELQTGAVNQGYIQYVNSGQRVSIGLAAANDSSGVNGGSILNVKNNGSVTVGTTSNLFSQTIGIHASASVGGSTGHFNRVSDGGIVRFGSDGTEEGNISISGTTVSYNGGHLARWSRLLDNSKDTSIVKGTVMTNLDEMVEWHHEAAAAQDAVLDEEGNVVTEAVEAKDAYTEENEQLNKMAVSSVEGDANVAGVFVNWDDEDDWNDMNVAMTGDMVIRIAQGTTVARGDLLMSAGDGTAKPQGDDIVRSKTIAKVTSTHVSHTYDDGSYLVPCVLMAC